MKIKVINCETGEEIVREMTDEEKQQIEIAVKKDAESLAKVQAKLAARQAIFERLGLSEDEAKILLS